MNGTSLAFAAKDSSLFLLNSLRFCFYALHPRETYYDKIEIMPDFIFMAIPGIILLIVMEIIVKMSTKGASASSWRLDDSMVNVATGVLAEAGKMFLFRGAEFAAYSWVYNHYRLLTLSYDSPYTYIFTMLGVDFGYYCWHRMAHETSIMWAFHHLHHSSEDYSVTTALRISFTMRYGVWIYFLHMAVIGVPPVTFMAHLQLTFAFGVWSHSECIPKLGKVIPFLGDIIEFILITPSHHRVHHGVNRYCIDKNYGQVFVIWDRMFGTFAEEREDEAITYGTTDSPKSFDIVGLQLSPWLDLWRKVKSMDTYEDKLKAIFYGPGWAPGKPRLGNEDEIPDVRGRRKFELQLPIWFSLYVAVQVLVLSFCYVEMLQRLQTIDDWLPAINLCYMFIAMTSLGGLYDGKFYSLYLEPTRIIVYLTLLQHFSILANDVIATAAIGIHVVSLLLFPAVASNIQERLLEKDGTLWSEEKGGKKREEIKVTKPNLQKDDAQRPKKLKSL